MTPWKTTNRSAVRPDAGFIVFEGIDGAGKSTQAKKLAEKLTGHGIPTLLTAEPSQSPAGRIIRSFETRPEPAEEVKLFTEDRRHHVQEVIQPALDEGRTVICDRYVYSSIAYQGARGIRPEEIISANRAFAIAPDLIFLLEVPVDVALSRIGAGRHQGASLFEARENLESVASIYSSLSDPLLQRLDGTATVAQIHARIVELLRGLAMFAKLERRPAPGLLPDPSSS
ncbi:MAG: dTMP kinase [Deltaproteobacteria bacterium]